MKYILIALFFSTSFCFSQKIKHPSNYEEVIAIYTSMVPDSTIQKSKMLPQDKFVALCLDMNSSLSKPITEWLYTADKKTPIEKYYGKLGIHHAGNIEEIIAITLYRHFNNQSLNHDSLVAQFVRIEKKWANEDEVRSSTDSLRGIYIPKDLNDCFHQIDSFWADSVKTEVKNWTEDDFIGQTHFGIGLWMRNNWQMWGGSRLSKYFNDMGVYHPDDMSGIVLTSYHRYLNGLDIKLDEQIKGYKEYWEKTKEK